MIGAVLRAVWNGPFWIGTVVQPVTLGAAILKILEVLWRVVVIVTAGALAIGLSIVFVDATHRPAPPLEDGIDMIVRYDDKRCGEQNPLLVRVKNNNPRTVGKVTFEIQAREIGHTTNLVYDAQRYYNDRILGSKGIALGCYALPTLPENVSVSFLSYTAKVEFVEPYGDGTK